MDTTDNQRKFTGIFLPAWVLDLHLPSQAEKLYCIILALQGSEGCFASSRYLGDQIGTTERQAQTWIKLLRERGLVRIGKADGRRRWLVATLDNPNLPKGEAGLRGSPEENRGAAPQETSPQPRRKPRTYIKEDSKLDNKKDEPPQRTVHSLAKDIFLFHYKHWVEADYPYWEGKDAGGLSSLLKKVRTIAEAHREETRPGSPPLTEVELLDNFDSFLTKVGLLGAEDEFILNNFTPAYINGQFNKLVTSLRNKANGNYKERLRQTRAALRANDRAQQWGELLNFAGRPTGTE